MLMLVSMLVLMVMSMIWMIKQVEGSPWSAPAPDQGSEPIGGRLWPGKDKVCCYFDMNY